MTESSLEQQYASLQKQYDAQVGSHEKLLGAHNALRKERDELWGEADRLRSELTALQNERNELSSKLAALRGEVKFTMDDVVADRDARLGELRAQHETMISETRERYGRELEVGGWVGGWVGERACQRETGRVCSTRGWWRTCGSGQGGTRGG
jgi:predicted  nucleic acid-binding Zn-ribbon protein